MSTISRFVGEGGGPRRTRARLVALTGPVCAAAAGLSSGQEQAARLVSGELPADLLGGDLLAVLSDQLRAALVAEEAVPGALPRPAATVRPGLSRADSRVTRPGPAAGRAPAVRDPAGVLPPPEPGPGHPFAASPRDPGARVPWDAEAGRAPAGHAGTGNGSRPPDRSWGTVEPPPGRPDRLGTLERALAEYFRPDHRPPVPARRPASPTEASAPGPRTPEMPRPQAPPRPSRAMTEDQVAERLRAFAGGEAPAPQARGDHPAPAGTATEPGGQPGAGGAEQHDRSLTDLSEQLTDILRRQAVQHGIDVT